MSGFRSNARFVLDGVRPFSEDACLSRIAFRSTLATLPPCSWSNVVAVGGVFHHFSAPHGRAIGMLRPLSACIDYSPYWYCILYTR